MKFNNIEAVWAFAKSKLPNNCVIYDIAKTGSSKYFDLIVPKSLVKKAPEDSKKGDLIYSFTETAGKIEVFLENNALSMDIYDTRDFYLAVSQFLGINESKMNEQEVYFVEDSVIPGYDKTITFGMWMGQDEAKKIFNKISKTYLLNPLPDGEATLDIKAKDEKKFTDAITKLIESSTGYWTIASESYDGVKAGDKIFIYDTKPFGGSQVKVTFSKKGESRIRSFIIDINDTNYKDMIKNKINEDSDYQEFFKQKLQSWNVESPADLSQEDRSKFFSEIKSEWKSQKKQDVNEAWTEEFKPEYKFENKLTKAGKKNIQKLLGTDKNLVGFLEGSEGYSDIFDYTDDTKRCKEAKTVEFYDFEEDHDYEAILYQDKKNKDIKIVYELCVDNDWSFIIMTEETLELLKGMNESFPHNAISTGRVASISASDAQLMSTNDIRTYLNNIVDMMNTYATEASTDSAVAYRELEDSKRLLLSELASRGFKN